MVGRLHYSDSIIMVHTIPTVEVSELFAVKVGLMLLELIVPVLTALLLRSIFIMLYDQRGPLFVDVWCIDLSGQN